MKPELEEAARKWAQKNARGNMDYDTAVAAYLAGVAAKGDRWISVSKDLPKHSGEVLGYVTDKYEPSVGDVFVCHYSPSKKIFEVWGSSGSKKTDMNITHWMPLPAAPDATPAPKLPLSALAEDEKTCRDIAEWLGCKLVRATDRGEYATIDLQDFLGLV